MNEREKELVVRALEGGTDSFGELVDLYWEKVSALVYQKLGSFPEVEDIIQETFIRAYGRLGQLRKPGNFAAWLYQIASKLCIDHVRGRKKSVSLDTMREKDYQFAQRETQTVVSGLFQEILEAISSLSEIYRVVVTLRFMEGMSCKDISEHLGEPHGTIRNRLFRANEILRRKLTKALREYRLGAVGKAQDKGKTGESD